MHELGIVTEVVAIATEASGGARVRRIVLEVGQLSMVVPDALRFAFDLAAEGTAVEGAVLDIVEVPGRARCGACGGEVVLEDLLGQCGCGSVDLDWLSGDELRIAELEVA
jgi:hydrogenase nickel incorporation protein HypA/HybF